nr:WD40 repeat domain-containing protein [Alkalibacter mobilis]
MIFNTDDFKEYYFSKEGIYAYEQIEISPKDKYVAGGVFDKVVCWDVGSGEIVLEFMFDSGGGITDLSFSYDEKLLAVASVEGVSVIEIGTGAILWTTGENYGNQIYKVDFSPMGNYVLANHEKLELYDAREGTLVSNFSGILVSDAIFAETDDRVLISTLDGVSGEFLTPVGATVQEIDDFDGELFTTSRYTDPLQDDIKLTTEHVLGDMYTIGNSDLYSSSDGNYLALSHADGFIEVFDLNQGSNPVYAIAEHQMMVNDILFSEKVMATGCGDGRSMIFDLETGKIRSVLSLDHPIENIEFSQDGTKMMMYCPDIKSAFIFSVDSGEYLFKMESDNTMTKFGFTPDNKKAVMLLEDGTAIVGSLYTGVKELILAAENLID